MRTIFAYFETSAGSCFRGMPNGVWGDPRGSSAELGEQFFEQIALAVGIQIDVVEATLSMSVGNALRR